MHYFKILKSTVIKELASLADYFRANKLKLNVEKTKMVCFKRKSKIRSNDNLEIFLNGDKVEIVEQNFVVSLRFS